ncbi:MAG: RHS repeat-associated core domain-containing protein [Pseudonocardiaceae bacterium]
MVDVGFARGRVSMLMAWLVLAAGACGLFVSAAQAAHGRVRRESVLAAGRAGFSPTAKELAASTLRTARASRTLAPVKAGRKVPWLSRADSNTFVAGSGHLAAKIYPFPVNYRSAAGKWTAINTGLRTSGSGYGQRANDLGVRLPRSAAEPARVADRSGGLSFGLAGAAGIGRVAGTTDRFTGALSGVDLAYSSQTDGIGWQARLSAAVASQGLSWTVKLSHGLTAKLVSGGVAFRTASGRVAWVFQAPSARAGGSGQPVALRLWLSRSARGVVIHLAPAPTAAARSLAMFSPGMGSRMIPAVAPNPTPIIWSGQVVAGSYQSLGPALMTGDCYVDSTAPDTSFCGGNTNYVGPNDHTLLNFDVADNLPLHVQVLQSFIGVQLTSESTSTPDTVGVWQAAEPWTNLASWNSYDGTNNWTTPGGDTTGQMDDYDQIGQASDVGNTFYWNITPTVQGWVDQNPAQVDGLLFAPTDGSSAPNTLGFATETSSDGPYMQVDYEPRMGDYPNAKYDTQQLTSRSSEGVNVATDNLLVSNSDLNLTGVNGLNLQVGRYYNDLSGDQGSFGVGWTMGTGADTYLEVPADGQGTVDYFDGTGNAETFQLSPANETTEVSPPGEDGQLTMNDAGDPYSSSTLTLAFRHSGVIETYTKPADTNNVIARLSSVHDRNGNTIHYNYNSSGQLSSIVDSYGNTTTISYSPDGYVDQIADPTGRTYKYFQNSAGQLTQYEDPAGNTTDYSYDGYGNLTQITTPAGNVTKIHYDAGNTNQVTSVSRRVHPTDTSGPKTTYQFGPANICANRGSGWSADTVEDPGRHTTVYCTDDLGRLTQVLDANGNTRSTSYNPDGFVSQLMTPLGIPTNFSYATDGTDNISQIQQGSSTPLTTSISYTDPANPYLPTQTTDPQNNSLDAAYDGAGNLTQTKEPTSGDQASLSYNSDGTVATSTDPDSNQTTYSYTNHNLTTVTPPAGSGLNPIHLSYDSADRVTEISSISGSTGHEVEYSYNDFDQIIQAVYKNAAGTTVATFSYSYDNDGHLISRTGPAGQTTYNYDGLGRPTSVSYPGGGSVSYGYDAASNLTSLTDAGGKVSYHYDKANQLTAVIDPGTYTPAATLNYNHDGLLTSTTYHSGASIVDAYNSLDQLTKVTDTYKTAAGQAAHLSYAYTYDGTLQQTMTDQAGNQTTYSYDALNRLTQAQTANGSTTTANYAYTLDSAGNILKQAASGTGVTASTTSYAYNPANQICWSYQGSSTAGCSSPPTGASIYSYDADGNQTSNGSGLTMTYNALDQMTSATTGGTTTNYSYLVQGQEEIVGDGTTTRQNDQLGLASQTTGSHTTYYTRSLTGAQIDERAPSGTYDYLYDGNGNVVGLVDSAGHLVKQYAYDPYGNQTTNTGSVANPFGYQDGYTISTGLIHFGARYLNPGQGSWTQQDPLSQITSLTQNNEYIYAGDNPINLSDETGRAVHIYEFTAAEAREIGFALVTGSTPTTDVPYVGFLLGPIAAYLGGQFLKCGHSGARHCDLTIHTFSPFGFDTYIPYSAYVNPPS